jgi:hypothetical protein
LFRAATVLGAGYGLRATMTATFVQLRSHHPLGTWGCPKPALIGRPSLPRSGFLGPREFSIANRTKKYGFERLAHEARRAAR